MPSNLLPTEPTYSSGTTDEGEYLSAGERKAIFKKRRVSGADFKRGSSAGSSVGEARGEKLTSKNYNVAVDIASFPDQIRGFGHVKAKNLRVAEECKNNLMNAFNE